MPRRDELKRSAYIEYRKEVEGERMARSLRAGCAVVALLSTAFIPLDFAVFRDRFIPMLVFRLFCNGVMVLIIVRTARTRPLESAIVGCLTTGAMLLTVIEAAGGVTSDYTPGLMLLFLGIPVLLPFTAVQAGVIVAVLTSALASLPFLSGQMIDVESYSLHLVFPLAAGIESIAASALLERMRLADFVRRRQIEKARDDLKELDREKSRFTANIHHELRTPLTLMLAPVDGLLAGDFGEIADLPRSYLGSVQSNGQRLLKLISNLLDLAKIEGKNFSINRRPTGLSELIERFVSSARPLADRKGISLRTSGLSELPVIFVDPEAIEKIIANLLGNALKFTEAGGHVDVIGTRNDDGDIHLTVADTGAGLAEDQLERIFDRFAQVDTSSTRKYEGTGIGLALVRELVELHAGRVWAASAGLGDGAQMHVLLPEGTPDEDVGEILMLTGDSEPDQRRDPFAAFDDEPRTESFGERNLSLLEILRDVRRAETGESSEESPGTITNTLEDAPKVLVVEDNDDMRRLLAFLLGKEFRVETAKNGREGLEKVRSARIDLVITDVMMPEMSGTELCQAIKEDPASNTIPVILVTSKAERDMKIRGLELGADDYVTKPFHPRELMARARSLVRVRNLLDELAMKNARLESTNAELEDTLAELKDAESALVQAERLAAVGELAAGVAHEVNNPVNFAANALHTLQAYASDVGAVASKIEDIDWRNREGAVLKISEIEDLKDEVGFDEISDSLTELVEIATEGLDRTQRLVNDLKDFATPGRVLGGIVDVTRGIRSTVQLIRYAMRERGVALHLDLCEDLPAITGDPRALNQVFLNLLKNASESVTPQTGNVWAASYREGDRVMVEIRDDGIGIPLEHLDQLFDPFFSTKGAGKGTGLGLSISRRIVMEHGGSIEVNSKCGEGSIFIVTLPIGAAVWEGDGAAET
jgi:signal transduction histidine kinase